MVLIISSKDDSTTHDVIDWLLHRSIYYLVIYTNGSLKI